MRTEDFYDILDDDIGSIVERFADLPAIAKYKDINQKKSYGFLIWFLDFYGHLTRFNDYITNGHGDASCDIIFSRPAAKGETVFYVVQSKWSNRKNALGRIKANDIKYSLNDFQLVIQGNKQKTSNDAFNKSYEALREHLVKNGKVRFIVLALAKESEDYRDNINSFRKEHFPNCSLDVIDIERMKRDYIDRKYKHILKDSPLEPYFDPDSTKINLEFERFADVAGKGDMIVKKNGYRAYVMMVTPGFLHRLFSTYGFSLFYRNIRNPLPESNFNRQMADTLQKRPPMFWYFNNGITAIARIVPEIGHEAREAEVFGFQIINGAQTVYTVYRAYEEASPVDREAIDNDALIMLRLVQSNDVEFSFQVTRYTNSQNPMVDRDFHANDDIQVRLQTESFDYPYWYEKRRGEFLQVPDGVQIIDNFSLALAYITFSMDNIHIVTNKKDLIFISQTTNPDGLYEWVFNSRKITFRDMLASYLFIERIMEVLHPTRSKTASRRRISWEAADKYTLMAMAVSPFVKYVLSQYLGLKLGISPDDINITHYILEKPIDQHIITNTLDITLRELKLKKKNGEIDFNAFEGQETVNQTISRMNTSRGGQKPYIFLDFQGLGVEYFEKAKQD